MKGEKYLWRIAIVLMTFAFGVGIVWMLAKDSIPVNVRIEPSQNQPRQFPVSDEGYAVISAVLSSTNIYEQIVISDHAFDEIPNQRINAFDYENYDLSKEVIDDYIRSNADRYKVENKFTVPGNFFLISQQEADMLVPQDTDGEWIKFRERFPKSRNRITYFSNVGFNREKTEALVYVASQCRTCDGVFFFLKKHNGKWFPSEKFFIYLDKQLKARNQ